MAQLRLDLAEALRGRGQAQTRLRAAEAELTSLRSKNKAETRRVVDLTAERNALTARVRDLNEELEEKRKFLKVRRLLRCHRRVTPEAMWCLFVDIRPH